MKKNYTRGFTIFFATLVGALSLAIGLAIYDLTVRELTLSVTQSLSESAIYAADTGAECALYWDSKYTINNDADNSAFATSSDYVYGGIATPGQALCAGNDIVAGSAPRSIPWNFGEPDSASAQTVFYISMGPNIASPCADVSVSKTATQGQGTLKTTITSHGFNTCNLGDPNRVERILQVNY